MGADVRSQTYQGVEVDHPDIVAATQNMLKGSNKFRQPLKTSNPEHLKELIKRIGQPGEVIRKIEREMKP